MKKRSRDSATILTGSILRLIISVILFLGFATVIATGHQLWEQAAMNSNSIMASMKHVTIDSQRDWDNWRHNSNVDQSTLYFVAVHNRHPGANRTHYFTPHAKYLVKHRIKLTHSLFYSPKIGLLYRQTGHAHGVNYVVWTQMNLQVDVLSRIVLVTLIVMIVAIAISIVYTRHLSHRLTSPLMQLVADTRSQSKNVSEMVQISVPAEPSEVKRLAESFNHLLKERFTSQKEQQRFLMNATHELKTPIAAIYSNVQLIERHGKDHPEIIPKSIHYISTESQQMRQSIDQMLALSRADAMTVNLVSTDVSQVLKQELTRLAPTIKQQLDVKITPGLMAKMPNDGLPQIIDNLVGNAAKYSPSKTTIMVRLHSTEDGDLQLTVADQGPGISEADKPNVFKRFYRSDAVRGETEGSGLGLSIVKRLAEIAHGTIKLTDASPHGTIFTLTFPQA